MLAASTMSQVRAHPSAMQNLISRGPSARVSATVHSIICRWCRDHRVLQTEGQDPHGHAQ